MRITIETDDTIVTSGSALGLGGDPGASSFNAGAATLPDIAGGVDPTADGRAFDAGAAPGMGGGAGANGATTAIDAGAAPRL